MSTKKMLTKHFDMKDLGVADIILGIKTTRTSSEIKLSQSHYIDKVLEKFEKYGIKGTNNPYSPSLILHKNRGNSVSQIEYARIIGSLMYIMNCATPDIAYAVNKLSRDTSNPSQHHWDALLRVLGYLKNTSQYTLTYRKYPTVLEGYSDANWISDSEETSIAQSTMELEFIALDKAGEEAEWLHNFFEDIPLWPKPVSAICIGYMYTL